MKTKCIDCDTEFEVGARRYFCETCAVKAIDLGEDPPARKTKPEPKLSLTEALKARREAAKK